MTKFEKEELYTPSLEEVAKVLNEGLKPYFETVTVTAVQCPNLTTEPFRLAGEGLGGETAIADVGGVPYLIPLVQRDKKYNLKDVVEKTGIPNALAIGAGAGPFHLVGTNCEMMANVKFGETEINNTHIAKIKDDGKPCLQKVGESTDFGVLGNFFISEGKPGKVLCVHVKKRTGSDNFVTAMRQVLKSHFGTKPVGIGGAFLLKKGKAKLHIMPAFSSMPLKSDDDVNNWLKFFNMSSPLVCLSVFISHDPGLDLRFEHTHCFSDHGDGGHYHIDTEPEEAEYLGYFNIAQNVYRVDRPSVTHQIGRD